MLTTEPEPAAFIGGTKAWQTSMVPIRLFSVSTLMSSNETSSALLGLGLLPEAPMSPPAQLTRMWTGPSLASISCFIAATAALSPMLPLTATTRPPCFAISAATASRSRASPYLAGAVQLMSWIATSAPSSARRSAITRPRPRPDPVTKAVLPLSSLVNSVSSVGEQAERAHVGGAAADHGEFVVGDRAVVAPLPGCAVIRVVGQAVEARRGEAGGERGRGLRRIASPPFRPQPADMPRLERAGLQHRGQRRMVGAQQIEHRGKRNCAVADRAAHETIAFVGELHAIVLEMDVPDMRGNARGEIERRLGDGKRVAGIEADADNTFPEI